MQMNWSHDRARSTAVASGDGVRARESKSPSNDVISVCVVSQATETDTIWESERNKKNGI